MVLGSNYCSPFVKGLPLADVEGSASCPTKPTCPTAQEAKEFQFQIVGGQTRLTPGFIVGYSTPAVQDFEKL